MYIDICMVKFEGVRRGEKKSWGASTYFQGEAKREGDREGEKKHF